MNVRGLPRGVRGSLFWQVALTDSSTLNSDSLSINLTVRVCRRTVKGGEGVSVRAGWRVCGTCHENVINNEHMGGGVGGFLWTYEPRPPTLPRIQ